jgi:DNA repair exonuclease SbcCD ATPase subunit
MPITIAFWFAKIFSKSNAFAWGTAMNTNYLRTIQVKQRIAELTNKVSNARFTVEQSEEVIRTTTEELEALTHQINILSKAQKVVQEMIASYSLEQIKRLEVVVTRCLRTVFYDKELSFEVEIVDKRNVKNVFFYITETVGDKTYRFPLDTSSVAGGILVVTSFIIQIYFITFFKLPQIVFLDEAFSQVSDQYIPFLNQLLYGLKDAYGLIVVLITHDPRFSELAERTYEVANGVYSLVESDL